MQLVGGCDGAVQRLIESQSFIFQSARQQEYQLKTTKGTGWVDFKKIDQGWARTCNLQFYVS